MKITEIVKEKLKEKKELKIEKEKYHKLAHKKGWGQSGKHIFEVLGEVNYFKYDNICNQLIEAEATPEGMQTIIKESLEFLEKYLEEEQSEDCICETCTMVRERITDLKSALKLIEEAK